METKITKKQYVKKKRRSKTSKKEGLAEDEYEEYLCSVYGFSFIAGYTDSGIPFGIAYDNLDFESADEDIVVDIEIYESDEIPF